MRERDAGAVRAARRAGRHRGVPGEGVRRGAWQLLARVARGGPGWLPGPLERRPRPEGPCEGRLDRPVSTTPGRPVPNSGPRCQCWRRAVLAPVDRGRSWTLRTQSQLRQDFSVTPIVLQSSSHTSTPTKVFFLGSSQHCSLGYFTSLSWNELRNACRITVVITRKAYAVNACSYSSLFSACFLTRLYYELPYWV